MSVVQPVEIKVLLVGDSGVGKTTYINRVLTGDYSKEFVPLTMHPSIRTMYLKGVVFKIWDCPGKLSKGLDAVSDGAQFAIIMFDVSNRLSYEHAHAWLEKVRAHNIPYIIAGNKMDLVKPKKTYDDKYYGISAKSSYNLEKPFLEIGRAIIGPHFELECNDY
jgi:GTP-binding nuclear protein Ran